MADSKLKIKVQGRKVAKKGTVVQGVVDEVAPRVPLVRQRNAAADQDLVQRVMKLKSKPRGAVERWQ